MGSCSSCKSNKKKFEKSLNLTTSASQTPIRAAQHNFKLNLQCIENIQQNLHKEKNDEDCISPPPKIVCNGNSRASRRESVFEKEKILTPRQQSSQLKVPPKEEILFGRRVRYSNSRL